MAHAISTSARGLAFVLSALAVCAFTAISTPNVSAQTPETLEEDTIHLGAPLEKGDKGIDKGKPPVNPPVNPPTTPESGPGTIAALALVAGAGYWTLRRSQLAKSYAVVQN